MQKVTNHRDSERRQATVLFADISGFTAMSEKMDPEEVTMLMSSCFKVLGEVAEHYGGHIDKFIGDCMMVLFGVPHAIENAPYQAVNAAIEIRNTLKQFNRDKNLAIPLDIHMGINTGTVVAGTIGSDTKKEFTVMGDTVNTASRLESVSENGQILVGRETYNQTKKAFQYRELPSVNLRGKVEAISAYEVLSVEGKKCRPQVDSERMVFSEMVGRDEELARLELQVMKVVHGEGSIINIIGEAGIGKSRLMAELTNSDAMKRVTLLEGRAVSMGRTLSFHPIIDLLKSWANIGDDDDQKQEVKKLRAAIQLVHPSKVDEILPFVATLMGLPLSGSNAERIEGIEGEPLEKLILKNLWDLIIKVSEKTPLVIVIEDLHWADESSLTLLESLFRSIKEKSIIFINVFRPGYQETGERTIKTINELYSDYYVEIRLRPLDENLSELFVNNILKIKELPHTLRNRIIKRAGGNPFFIEEIVRSLVDEGALTVERGIFGVTEKINNVVIPNTIQDVIMTRVDRLDEKTRDLLRIASVIGRSFFYRILIELVGESEQINSKLSHLKDIQLIRERMRMDELEYIFKHALVQETAYESILLQKRKEYHLRIANSFENVFDQRLHEFYGILAYHYSKGDDLDRAKFYMEKAGEEALKSSASSEALIYYREALNLFLEKYGEAADPKMLAELEQNIGKAFLNKGQFANAAKYFNNALERMGKGISSNRVAAGISFMFNAFLLFFKLYLPLISFNKKPKKEDIELIYLERNLRLCLVYLDAKQFFVESIKGLSNLISFDLKNVENGILIWASFSGVFSFSGIFFNLSGKILDNAEALIDKENVREYFVYSQRHLLYNYFLGKWNEIHEYDENLVNLNLEKGEIWEVSNYITFYAFLRIDQGQFSETGQLINLLTKIEELFQTEQCKAFKYWLSSKLLIKNRTFYSSHFDINEAISFYNRTGNEGQIYSLGCKAIMQILLEDIDGAKETLKLTSDIVQVKEHWPPVHISTYLISTSLMSLYMLEESICTNNNVNITKYRKEAYQNIRRVLKNSRKYASDKIVAQCLMGSYFWLTNKQKLAVKHWGNSIQVGEKLEALPDLARTYMEVGKRLLEKKSRFAALNNIKAEDYLEKARKIFKEHDLQWDLEQLEN
jgi:class 3 adenylate cyclase